MKELLFCLKCIIDSLVQKCINTDCTLIFYLPINPIFISLLSALGVYKSLQLYSLMRSRCTIGFMYTILLYNVGVLKPYEVQTRDRI